MISMVFFAVGCKDSATASTTAEQEPDPPVKITDIVEGTGPGAQEGDLLMLEYTGTFPGTGLEFDSNAKRDPDTGDGLQPPYIVILGSSDVIEGWHEGLKGIKMGGERLMEIPWQKAYGEAGRAPSIGEKQNLNFTIKLLEIVRFLEDGMYDVDDLVHGTGRAVEEGDTVTIHYRGTYANGARFDDSRKRGDEDAGGEPTVFKVGSDQAIRGIDVGVVGMQVGGKRWLRIPPKLAYGAGGYSVIQGNQVLFFEIDLLAIE